MIAPHIPARVAVPTFTQRFSATRRGARLARLLAAHQLTVWGHVHGTPLFNSVTLVVAELASNAVLHGLVPGRDFTLRLTHDDERCLIRIEVSDTHPALPVRLEATDEEDRGRGLLLVDALAARWGVTDRNGPGKTVWAECALPRSGESM
ncbi:ATP-binding protein [Streptomyces sp. GC420]|uniref:ATP-binding protein n=1 Tax=Streptomyces sp. GC420 TaxID=2697568 RepID=UPI001414D687|nr:ATP-binding protein [Streptomyces sp. GC420]NBM15012.1 ATP-binding protein [Streptomyces sp. GC420]